MGHLFLPTDAKMFPRKTGSRRHLPRIRQCEPFFTPIFNKGSMGLLFTHFSLGIQCLGTTIKLLKHGFNRNQSLHPFLSSLLTLHQARFLRWRHLAHRGQMLSKSMLRPECWRSSSAHSGVWGRKHRQSVCWMIIPILLPPMRIRVHTMELLLS